MYVLYFRTFVNWIMIILGKCCLEIIVIIQLRQGTGLSISEWPSLHEGHPLAGRGLQVIGRYDTGPRQSQGRKLTEAGNPEGGKGIAIATHPC